MHIFKKKQKKGSVAKPICEPDNLEEIGRPFDREVERIGLLVSQTHFPDNKSAYPENINGPSLLRVPDWIENPLGKYYLYFAHHAGAYIRLAYADTIAGPYTIYKDGTLKTKDHPIRGIGHVASPDILINDKKKEIWMYFHAGIRKRYNRFYKIPKQNTYLATSHDGIHFNVERTHLCPSYFKAFKYRNEIYGVAKGAPNKGRLVYRTNQGRGPFAKGPAFLEGCRHHAVYREDSTLFLFFTRKNDVPERILYAKIDITDVNWMNWSCIDEKISLLMVPKKNWEGTDQLYREPNPGAVRRKVRQLRDPAIFEEDGKIYILYSVAGEYGIGLARIK